MKIIVSKLAILPFFSKIKKELINGPISWGIVAGYY